MIFIIIPTLNEPRINEEVEALSDILYDYSAESFCIIVAMGDKEKLNNHKKAENSDVFYTYGDTLERSILNAYSYSFKINNNPHDKLVVMDGDFSHSLSDLEKMLDELLLHDMVVGSRFVGEGSYKSSVFRKVVSFAFKALAEFKGSKMTDPTSGFFGIHRKTLEGMKFVPITWKTCLEIELYYKKHDKTLDLKEVPVHFKDRTEGLPKSGSKIALKLFRDLVMY